MAPRARFEIIPGGLFSKHALGRLLWLVGLAGAVPVPAGAAEDRWWPAQALPKAIVQTSNEEEFPQPRVALQMMVQSVAGLAAKAVNEGRGEELVWVNNRNADMEDWHARLMALHPEWETRGVFSPWDLADRYIKQGLIKGYVLYRADTSAGAGGGMDCSVNVATSVAGLLDGIMVEEKLEDQAKAHGLKLLLDAREKTEQWCFQIYQGQFTRRMLCLQDPRKPNIRDLAIAQKAFTVFASEETTRAAAAWLEPLSPILGCGAGDEFVKTDLTTRQGSLQSSTDWCLDLPVLMAGTGQLSLPKQKNPDPRTMDWSDGRSAVCFIDTDGDNVQWQEGNFFREGGSYWANPDRGKIPFGWSCCFSQLAQLCPEAIAYALATQSRNDSFIEWGGGYYYPDRFGLERTNRWELLARQAERTWELMKKTNTRMIGFNFSRFDSPDARKACEVFAAQTDGLLAILAFQYYPYEGGAGKTFWVKDRNGEEVPVISARYTIWEHAGSRERAGTPARVARAIRDTVEKSPADQLPRYDWVIAHAWSWFKRAPGSDENAEDMRQENAAAQGGVCGYSPVTWCAERLPEGIRVVSPEELAWRIRMKHDGAATRKLISQLQ
ncbi:MAG: hypothetical protein ABSG04_14615 [Verrucomicrobiota bacterium]